VGDTKLELFECVTSAITRLILWWLWHHYLWSHLKPLTWHLHHLSKKG